MVREVITDYDHWVGVFARAEQYCRPVGPADADAHRFCAVGAFRRVATGLANRETSLWR